MRQRDGLCLSGENHIQRFGKGVADLMDHLIHIFREIIAPGLAVVQLNHWQTCVDLRTRHVSLLKEVVEILRNRNVDLWDAEGDVMITNTIP